MRKNDIPLIDKAIDDVVMSAIYGMQAPRDMIGGHEQILNVVKYFRKDCKQKAFITSLMEYLSQRRLFAVYDEVTCQIGVTINFAVCQMTPRQCRAFNQKFHLAVAA